MRTLRSLLCLVLVCGTVFAARAAHTQARLLLAADTARPGDSVLAGVQLRMDPNWHTYWQNPGASGMATTIKWALPPGVTAGQIQWPIPEKLPDAELTTYIYKDEVVLLVPLKLAPDLKPGTLSLKATVSWLECDVSCVKGDAEVTGVMTIGTETKPSANAGVLTAWEKKLPKTVAGLSAHAWWENAGVGSNRPLVLEWNGGATVKEPDFFPDSSEQFEVQGPTERLPAEPGKVRLLKQVTKMEGDWPREVSGVLVQGVGEERIGCQVSIPVQAGGTESANLVPQPLWLMLLYGFLGGLILNLMPCVLPVIALKILGFVAQAKNEPHEARKLGLIYALGVLVSFIALAFLFIGLQAAGHRAGWGIQFSSPYFLVVMTTLVTLIALNLFGVFEVTLGGRVMGAASGAAAQEGAAGAFFNGLLAVVLATSCTAPILGSAVGYALTTGQGPAVIVVMFIMLGIGLAFPYVLLSWQPAWLKFVPKPGPWMERFKVAMGFPMLAAAVWLFSLASLHYGERSWWLAVFLVMVALAAWVYGEFVQRHQLLPAFARGVCLAVLLAAYAFALEGHLRWREPLTGTNANASVDREAGGIPWQQWTPAALAQARKQGRPVLVDFTAKWCLTCNTLVKPALESASVRKKVQELNAVALLGDYTGFSDEIGDELKHFGRAGVPLVLVYPKDPDAPAIVLPEAVTPGMVVNALERAGK